MAHALPRPSLAALALLALAGCSALAPPSERAPPADLTLRHVTFEQHRAGQLAARADIAEVRYFRELGRAELASLVLSPIDSGHPTGTLTAKDGLADLHAGTMKLEGGVSWATRDHDRIDTASCTLDLAAKTAVGTEPVEVRGSGYTLQAPGFTGEFSDDPVVSLKGGVKATLEAAPAPPKKPGPPRRRPK